MKRRIKVIIEIEIDSDEVDEDIAAQIIDEEELIALIQIGAQKSADEAIDRFDSIFDGTVLLSAQGEISAPYDPSNEPF